MNRILVIGSAGAGKSTLSQKLSQILDLPVIHLDKYFWHPNWIPTPDDEWDKTVEQFSKQEKWIMDGNYSRTIDIRMKRADTIIFLDMPMLLCIYRVIKRRIKYNNRTRPDMNEGCPEKLDWEFLKWVWNYKKRSRSKIMNKLDQAKDQKRVIIVKTRKQVNELLGQINKA
ncbi:DNA topology modulation protein [Paenibacillus sediminis]|uniref:Adenylate kinase family enzyme n=1 Tax=Paenibacillus sediminis TaxID=664909 RepID=A0ABS4H200_9BACL|nr:DNA topology modulation protein [Paenibacillus sediminis]MBP1936555.1 adenylate kinase family enzyme [Paenibacillus sediminis]